MSRTKMDYPTSLDDIDQWLFDFFGIIPGACASTENLRYTTARMVAEALWPKKEEKEMTNIEKIKAEIERRKKRWMYDDLPIAMGRYYEDRDLLAFIDSLPEETCKESLQVQETCKENQDSFTSLEEAADEYEDWVELYSQADFPTCVSFKQAFIAGAEWQANQMPMPEDTVIFMKGVAEGRRLEREDRNDDNLPRFYGD